MQFISNLQLLFDMIVAKKKLQQKIDRKNVKNLKITKKIPHDKHSIQRCKSIC